MYGALLLTLLLIKAVEHWRLSRARIRESHVAFQVIKDQSVYHVMYASLPSYIGIDIGNSNAFSGTS